MLKARIIRGFHRVFIVATPFWVFYVFFYLTGTYIEYSRTATWWEQWFQIVFLKSDSWALPIVFLIYPAIVYTVFRFFVWVSFWIADGFHGK